MKHKSMAEMNRERALKAKKKLMKIQTTRRKSVLQIFRIVYKNKKEEDETIPDAIDDIIYFIEVEILL